MKQKNNKTTKWDLELTSIMIIARQLSEGNRIKQTELSNVYDRLNNDK